LQQGVHQARRSAPLEHYQHAILVWVASQAGLTGAVIFAAGLLSAFHGVRMLRIVLPVVCAELGYALALALAAWAELAPLPVVAAFVVLSVVVALLRPRAAAVLASGITWALLGAFLAAQLGFKGLVVWATLALLGGMGTLLTVVSRPTMTILLTSLHGAAGMIVGFVGIAATVMPVVSDTFRSWADEQSLVIPVVLAMLVTAGYSCQANGMRGDLRVGQVDSERGRADPR
jgi:hypothetical protein